MSEADLLAEIEAFLTESGMGQTYFGHVATGNTELVNRLRAGKRVTLRTAENVREFIKDWRDEHQPQQPAEASAAADA